MDMRTPNMQKRPHKIPLMFEYIYPKSVIQPKAAYGWNVLGGFSSLSVT